MSRSQSFLMTISVVLCLFSCSRHADDTVNCMIGGPDPGMIDGPQACLWCEVISKADWAEKVGALDFAMDLQLKTVPMGFVFEGDSSFSVKYEEEDLTLRMTGRSEKSEKVDDGWRFDLIWRHKDAKGWPHDLSLDSLELALHRSVIWLDAGKDSGAPDSLLINSVRKTNCSEFHGWLNR